MRLPVVIFTLLTVSTITSAAETGDAFFESKVRPLLTEHCLDCHSAGKKVKGGLRLDHRGGWEKGGESGPAIVPAKPDASLLIKAVRYRDDDLAMPPDRKLTDSQIAAKNPSCLHDCSRDWRWFGEIEKPIRQNRSFKGWFAESIADSCLQNQLYDTCKLLLI